MGTKVDKQEQEKVLKRQKGAQAVVQRTCKWSVHVLKCLLVPSEADTGLCDQPSLDLSQKRDLTPDSQVSLFR
jgi:hypothetical protein